MDKIKLSIIIPAYNEAFNLKLRVLEKVSAYLAQQRYNFEVLIIDDGSTDSTRQMVKEKINGKKGFRLIEVDHGGKALAVITGMLEAKGEVVLFTDMDQATPINQLEKILPEFDRSLDIVIGSRKGREGAPMIRKISAYTFAIIRNLILGLPFTDSQCGFKAFNRGAVKAVFPKMLKIWQAMRASGAAVNAGFDVETLFIAKKGGFKIKEVSVEWHHVGTERVQLIRDSMEAIKDMIRIRISDWRGVYD